MSWRRIKEDLTNDDSTSYNGFSIIVPFRNEENNLLKLLNSFNQLKYPKDKFEIIFVDDHSEDNGVDVLVKNASSCNFKVLNSDFAGKKNAITHGVNNSMFDYIITIDADCEIKPHLIRAYNDKLFMSDYDLISAPVMYSESSLFDKFLNYELIGLVGIGASTLNVGNPTMANGANLCFKKNTFQDLFGYEGNLNVASGDDEFLLKKIYENGGKVSFLKNFDAIVTTEPPENLKKLINQRLRWASKWRKYSYLELMPQIFMFLFNVLILSLLFLFYFENWLLILFVKSIVDLIFMLPILKFYRRKDLIFVTFLIQFLYPIYIIFIALLAILKTNYNWKNRVVK